MLRRILPCLLMLLSLCALADDSFRISDIRIEGLQRISAGTVFAALPLNVGDLVDTDSLQDASQTLFKSGYFDDIKLGRDGTVLVITVVERPAVASIAIDGNKVITTDKLMEALKKAGVAEGLIFKRTVLDGLALELQRQYVAQGRYGATVDTKIENLPQNRVALTLKIKEGKSATIKHINIVGNTVFDEKVLLGLFELDTSNFWSWFSDKDKYSREKLEGDIERLKSWYMDRGYLRFKVDSTQVSLSPDKKSIYIVINISEGAIYQVNKVDLAGELKLPEEQIRRMLLLAPGRTFSQFLMTTSSERIKQRLGNEGYTSTEVKEVTDIDDDKHTVDVTFFVNPQERKYVRRIDFRGNTKTADDVLRREMRQMEGAVASSYRIEQSKTRMQRLGFFKSVDMETQDVPGTGDQMDLQYTVEESPSGSIGASVGFAQGSGFIFGANVQQDNFLGTGKSVGFNVSTSQATKQASFNYSDPYYTPDGVTRGFRLYYTTTDLAKLNISSYTVDTYGLDMNFGYPISELEQVNYGLGYAHNKITVGSTPAQEISATPTPPSYNEMTNQSDYDNCVAHPTGGTPTQSPFCANTYGENTLNTGTGTDYDLSNTGLNVLQSVPASSLSTASPQGFLDKYGTEFNTYTLSSTWRQSTLNNGRLATRGASQSITGEVTIPGSDLEYWKLIYRGQYYLPLTRQLTLRLKTQLGYGGGYGNTGELPFYEHFFAGGLGSVRGYQINTVGPRSTPAVIYPVVPATVAAGVSSNPAYIFCDVTGTYCTNATGKLATTTSSSIGDPFGGNILISGSADFIFPTPFVKDQRSLQSSFFIDTGNTFDSHCSSTQLNCSNIDLGQLRYSYGLSLTWITGFGPLAFSIARPIGNSQYDKTQFFQFSLGQTF
jgi:outer membrane protein insertion porin family